MKTVARPVLCLSLVLAAVAGSGCAGTRMLTCDDVVQWRPDYEEVGEAITQETPGLPTAAPDPKDLIGTLVCPAPSGYGYDTDLHVFYVYHRPAPSEPGETTTAVGLEEGEVPIERETVSTAPRDSELLARAPPDPPAPGGGPKPVDVIPGHGTKPAGTPPVTRIPLPPDAAPPTVRIPTEPVVTATPAATASVRFTDPAVKIADTARPAFTRAMVDEAIALEPLINVRGTQVHMGYWSGPGNRDALIRVLDEINTAPPTGGRRTEVAIWDEGVGSRVQFPSYQTMTAEAWYPRGSAPGGRFSIGGTPYVDPHPLTFPVADKIWGQFSQRYAQMALDISAATGKPIEVWCFVQGARADRIFHKWELPVLRDLEAAGAVRVNFSRPGVANPSFKNPGDWTVGTATAPTPAPPAPPPAPPPSPPPPGPTPPAPPP
jgi:hypothetical protein